MYWKHLTLIASLICGILCETVIVEPENVNGTVEVVANATRKSKKSVKPRRKLTQSSESLIESGEVPVLEELENYDYNNYDEGKNTAHFQGLSCKRKFPRGQWPLGFFQEFCNNIDSLT